MNQPADAGHDQDHDCGQRIDPKGNIDLQVAEVDPAQGGVEQETLVRLEVVDLHKSHQRQHKGEAHRADRNNMVSRLANMLLDQRPAYAVDDSPQQGQEDDPAQIRDKDRMLHSLALQAVGRLNVNGRKVLIDAKHDRQADHCLGGRQHDHKDREHLTVVLAGRVVRKGDVVDIGRVQDQLHTEENPNRVSAGQYTIEAEREDDQTDEQEVAEPDIEQNFVHNHPFSVGGEKKVVPS